MELALKGLKVADFTWVWAGPYITKYLADHGATVVRIESAKAPDFLRISAPFKDNKPGINRSGFFPYVNPNKYSMSLDLRHPKGKEVAKRLAVWADVVADNFTAGVMDRLGLGYKELKQLNPDIIMISCANQGATGPHAKHPGFGLQLVALAGITNLTGWPDRTPVQPLAAYADVIAPRFAAAVLLAAIDYRQRTGKGQFIDVSQLEAAIHFIAPLVLDFFANGRENTRNGNFCSCAAPHGVYRCKGDDRWCAIAVYTDEEWKSFCEVVGNPDWTLDKRFASLLDRKKNEAELDKLVEEWTVNYAAEDVMNTMQIRGVAAGVLENAKDILEDPQILDRRHFWQTEHSEIGPVLSFGQPFRLSKTPAQPRLAPPCLGEHTEYVCTQILGMSDSEFTELLNSGALA